MSKPILLSIFVLGVAPAWGGIIGSQVTGVLNINTFGSTNYFNSGNGFVPGSGYLNSAGGCGLPDCSVTISSSVPTFGFRDPSNLDVADFSNGTQLIITDTSAINGSNGFTMTFTDSQITGATKFSDTFGGGGLVLTFNGNTIQLVFPGAVLASTSQAVINLTFAPVPEPATVSMMLAGLCGLGWARHRRRGCKRYRKNEGFWVTVD